MDVAHSNVVYDQVFPGKRIVSIVPDISKVDSFDQQQKRVALHFTPDARGRTLSQPDFRLHHGKILGNSLYLESTSQAGLVAIWEDPSTWTTHRAVDHDIPRS